MVDEGQAYQQLTHMIATFGTARTIAWLAEILEERSDAFLIAAEHRRAAEAMRDFRVVQAAATKIRKG
jgi:hypothetical protein